MTSNNCFSLRLQLISEARKLRKALQGKDGNLIQRITARVSRLIDQLRTVIPWHEIKRILASVGLVVALQASPVKTTAQSFAPGIDNPFGLTTVYNGAWVASVDIDNDGDLDLFVGAYDEYYSNNVIYFENTGSATEPSFAEPIGNPFGIVVETGDFVMPTFADLDGDGDFDMLAGNYASILFLENTGTSAEPQFGASQTNPFGIDPQDYMFKPVLADLDNDGDLDLLVGTYYYDDSTYEAGVVYFENTGTKTDPEFAQPVENPFGETTGYYFSFPALADLDKDGDLDMMMGGLYSNYGESNDAELRYYENVGDVGNPQFSKSLVNPFGLSGSYYLAYPEFADMDGDGDLDLFVGELSSEESDFGSLKYYENLGVSAVTVVNESDKLHVVPVPANTQINILTDLQVKSLEITNGIGIVRSIAPHQRTLDVSTLSSGLYILRVTDVDGTLHLRKIVVVR